MDPKKHKRALYEEAQQSLRAAVRDNRLENMRLPKELAARERRLAPQYELLEQIERLREMRRKITTSQVSSEWRDNAHEQQSSGVAGISALQRERLESAAHDLSIGIDPITRRREIPASHAEVLAPIVERALAGESDEAGRTAMAWLSHAAATLYAQHARTCTPLASASTPPPTPTRYHRPPIKPSDLAGRIISSSERACTGERKALYDAWGDITQSLKLSNNHVIDVFKQIEYPITRGAIIGSINRLGANGDPGKMFSFIAQDPQTTDAFLDAMQTVADRLDGSAMLTPAQRNAFTTALNAAVNQSRQATRGRF